MSPPMTPASFTSPRPIAEGAASAITRKKAKRSAAPPTRSQQAVAVGANREQDREDRVRRSHDRVRQSVDVEIDQCERDGDDREGQVGAQEYRLCCKLPAGHADGWLTTELPARQPMDDDVEEGPDRQAEHGGQGQQRSLEADRSPAVAPAQDIDAASPRLGSSRPPPQTE